MIQKTIFILTLVFAGLEPTDCGSHLPKENQCFTMTYDTIQITSFEESILNDSIKIKTIEEGLNKRLVSRKTKKTFHIQKK